MRFGLFASVLFHLCCAGVFLLWGKDWSKRTDLINEPVIPIELISEARLADRTNIPTITTKEPEAVAPQPVVPDDPQPIIREPEPVVIEPEPVRAPPVPATPKEPDPVEPEPVKAPEPKPEPKPEPPKPEPKPVKKPEKPKESGFDIDALEKDLQNLKDKPKTPRDPNETPGAVQGDTDIQGTGVGELTVTETALLKAHIKKCWTPLDGAPNAESLIVKVSFDLNRDGTLKGQPKVVNSFQINASGNRYWKVAENIAVRAVVECQPYNFLPPDRYENWKAFQFDFNPAEMAGL